jgi:type IV pilus assembly protein PilM
VLADLVGLATRLVVKNEPDASLLPPSIPAALAFRKRQPVFLAAAALLVMALLPPIYFLHRLVAARTEQVHAIDDQLMPLRSIQNRNETNLQQIEAAKKQIAALRGAYETKANWINFFSDLQERLVKVEEVWLERVHVTRAAPADAAAANEAPPPPEPPPAEGAAPAPAKPELRLTLSGRLLDVANPTSKVSPESFDRVKRLLASFTGSQFIAKVENEHFDNNQNGVLRFDFTLVINPAKPL